MEVVNVGYGVLLYTGSPDAEGTLGGLVETGRQISDHVRNALEYGELCSNDPVCASHSPTSPYERRFLHGAACHGCKPSLDVIMCLNVGRDGQDSRTDYEIRHRYITQFKKKQWPVGFPLPKLYFDPRAIDADPSKRASLHAKCIVVDKRYAFVSSANFTERGQKRNIEIGVRIDSPHIANGISNYILNLIDEQVLQKLI